MNPTLCLWGKRSHCWAGAVGKNSNLLIPCALWVCLGSRAKPMCCEGQGKGKAAQREQLWDSVPRVPAPAVPAGCGGLLKNLTRHKITLHVQCQNWREAIFSWDVCAGFPAEEVQRDFVELEVGEFWSVMRLIWNLITVGPDFTLRIQIAANAMWETAVILSQVSHHEILVPPRVWLIKSLRPRSNEWALCWNRWKYFLACSLGFPSSPISCPKQSGSNDQGMDIANSS